MTVYTVTPASNLATVNAGMVAGDTMLFSPGTYNITTALALVNGVAGGAATSYIGMPGAILHLAGTTNDIFDMETGTNHDIFIGGLTFDALGITSTANAGIFFAGNSGTTAAGKITIAGNTFQNFTGTLNAIFVYQGDNIVIVDNIATNVYQFLSDHNNDAGQAHSNHYICGNTITAPLRYAIEIQCAGSPPTPINNLIVNGNTVYLANVAGGFGDALSIVDNSVSSTHVEIIGNKVVGSGIGGGIEVAQQNATVAHNIFIGTQGGFLVGHGTEVFYGNIGINVEAANFFSQDGGWTAVQWVGANKVNGTVVVGWSGHPNDAIPVPRAASSPFLFDAAYMPGRAYSL
jgi:hypothetical protein